MFTALLKDSVISLKNNCLFALFGSLYAKTRSHFLFEKFNSKKIVSEILISSYFNLLRIRPCFIKTTFPPLLFSLSLLRKGNWYLLILNKWFLNFSCHFPWVANWSLDSSTGKYKSIMYKWILAREPQRISEKYICILFY